jgi:septal ring factor EnvC (AmiA/AmiB activator)
MLKKIILLIMVSMVTLSLAAQDKTVMEKERQELQKQIKQIQGQYNKVSGQKKQTIGQLTLIQRKIGLQDQYIRNISKEVRILDDSIFLSNVEITRLRKQLDTLKQQYSRRIIAGFIYIIIIEEISRAFALRINIIQPTPNICIMNSSR